MKKFVKTAGVTLLEVMLVLAIAAMIIVMSVRYYQSTNAANQANTVVQQITSIVAAADSLSVGPVLIRLPTFQLQLSHPSSDQWHDSPWGTPLPLAVLQLKLHHYYSVRQETFVR